MAPGIGWAIAAVEMAALIPEVIDIVEKGEEQYGMIQQEAERISSPPPSAEVTPTPSAEGANVDAQLAAKMEAPSLSGLNSGGEGGGNPLDMGTPPAPAQPTTSDERPGVTPDRKPPVATATNGQGIYDELGFGQAFATHKAKLKENGDINPIFKWRGNQYHTVTRDEIDRQKALDPGRKPTPP